MKILTVRTTTKFFETFKKILKTLKEGINNTANTKLLGTGKQTDEEAVKRIALVGFENLLNNL